MLHSFCLLDRISQSVSENIHIQMQNRLNDLDSKSYMKFLKSWCIYDENTLKDFICFFTKQKNENDKTNNVGIWGFNNADRTLLLGCERQLIDLGHYPSQRLSYAIIDLRKQIFPDKRQTLSFFEDKLKPILNHLLIYLNKRSYVTILSNNYVSDRLFFPSAWYIAKLSAQCFEMKDEKLICFNPEKTGFAYIPLAGNKIVIAHNMRNTLSNYKTDRSVYKSSRSFSFGQLKPWFILKPPPRKEKVKLHPAKFPEILVEQFINMYSQEGDNIFDPMSGTGSTLVAALTNNRKAYGCEITRHFYKIALERINNFQSANHSYLACEDAFFFDKHKSFPAFFDYIITSPPYWDMLNMNGAGTQKSRASQGLMVNYSDLDTDLGNYTNYETFLAELLKIYNKILKRLKPGGHFTIIIKNIKKKGTIYTFAWDLVEHLSKELSLVQLNYWLQDDIRIAPYGYGNAWVSNTFHHYCLTFKKS